MRVTKQSIKLKRQPLNAWGIQIQNPNSCIFHQIMEEVSNMPQAQLYLS
jgi:hypothetical protein